MDTKQRTCTRCGEDKLESQFAKYGHICHACKTADAEAARERRVIRTKWHNLTDDQRKRRKDAALKYQRACRSELGYAGVRQLLPDEAVLSIRRRYKHGLGKELAYEYGISQTAVSQIVNYITYKEVK